MKPPRVGTKMGVSFTVILIIAIYFQIFQYSTILLEWQRQREGFHNGSYPVAGDAGLPFLGDGLNLLIEGPPVLERRAREANSSVYRSYFLGDHTIVVTTAEFAAEMFDETKFSRVKALPWHVRKWVFGEGTLNTVEDPEHAHRKRFTMKTFGEDKLEQYVIDAIPFMKWHFDRWQLIPKLVGLDAFTNLYADMAAKFWWNIEDESTRRQFWSSIALQPKGFQALPIPLPGTTLYASSSARQHMIDYLAAVIQRRRDTNAAMPSDPKPIEAITAYRNVHGELSSAEAAAAELVNLARPTSLLGLFMTDLVGILHNRTDIVARVKKDIADHLSPSGQPITKASLENARYLSAVVNESRRYFQLTPLLSAYVNQSFVKNSIYFPRGVRVISAVDMIHRDPAVWIDPHNFNPDNFLQWDESNYTKRHGFLQHGGNDTHYHRCAGEKFTRLMMQLNLALLYRDYEWTIPAQDFSYSKASATNTFADHVIMENFHPQPQQ